MDSLPRLLFTGFTNGRHDSLYCVKIAFSSFRMKGQPWSKRRLMKKCGGWHKFTRYFLFHLTWTYKKSVIKH